MQDNPHVIYSKPFDHIGVPVWESRILQNHKTSETRRNDAFNLRYECRKLRDEKKIQTEWNTNQSNFHLNERIIEIDRWTECLNFCLDSTRKELFELNEELSFTERKLDSLDNPLAVILECISIRDNRRSTELTNDEVEEALKKELYLVQQMRKLLSEYCHTAWEKNNALKELICKLNNELNDKQEAFSIDNAQLNLNRGCSEITLKEDPLRIVKRSVPHESWIRNLEILKQEVEDHLIHSRKVREMLFTMREKAKNDMLEQFDFVEFLLRKRIYFTNKMKNEIYWQKRKTEEEMTKVAQEIKEVEFTLEDKLDPTRLVETRLENRSLRPGSEITSDEPENCLKEELFQIRQSKKKLMDQLASARSTYNVLEDQKMLIVRDLEDKSHTLDVDIKCLDTRKRLQADILFNQKDPK